MSAFLLKIAALLAMALDHIGNVCEPWSLASADIYRLLDGIGRIAFPIYAYLLVNGWLKTKDVNKYIGRLAAFAVISQIPFTLACYEVNLMPVTPGETLNLLHYNNWSIIPLILTILYWYLNNKKFDKSIILLVFALILSGFSVKVNGIWILSAGSLNVFYTLFIGLITINGLSKLSDWSKQNRYRNILLIISIALGIIYVTVRSDYGLAGVALICGLFIFRENRKLQIAVIFLWGIALYGIIHGNFYNAFFSCLSIIFVWLYNNKKGLSIKYLFYLFYPAHLFLLGLVNIAYRFK